MSIQSMQLREMIRKKRFEDGRLLSESCRAIQLQAPTLQLEASNGETWVLPWHHFVACHLNGEGGQETLRLTFMSREVVIRGMNLKQLVEEIGRQCLARLYTIEKKYSQTGTEECFVFEIEVRSHEEAL